MKPLVYFAFVLTFIFKAVSASAQAFTPPQQVQDGFAKKYLGETMIYEWRELDGSYIATFTHQDKFKYTMLDAEGRFLEDGESIDRMEIPDDIYAALPELDVTAFVHESFQAQNIKDDKGYLLIYETDVERIDFWVSNQGKILREKHYPIPAAPEEKEAEDNGDEVDWNGDGK